MYKGKCRNFIIILLLSVCISLTACNAHGRRDDTSTYSEKGMTTVDGQQTTGSEREVVDETGQKSTADDSASYIPDTTDYSRFYDDTPNTAEPRTYTEDEIELDITEDKYVSCVNDIYVYAEDYLGKMIRIEGMYLGEVFEGRDYHYIYRHGPGCCDTDGEMCGFEFTYNGDMPKDGDWIEVVGTLRQYLEGNLAYLTLDAISVTVKDEQGAKDVKE